MAGETETLTQLYKQALAEQDPHRLTELVEEIYLRLEEKEQHDKRDEEVPEPTLGSLPRQHVASTNCP